MSMRNIKELFLENVIYQRLLLLGMIFIFSIPVFLTDFRNDMITYSVIAQKITDGFIMYKSAVDSKPPLFLYIYGLIEIIFRSYAYVAIKFITVVVVFITAVLLQKIAEKWWNRETAFLVSVIYILAQASGWIDDFIAINAEIYFNLFFALAILMVSHLKENRSFHYFFAGFFVGLGALMRVQGGIALAAIGVLILLLDYKHISKIFINGFSLAAGFAVPWFVVFAVFYKFNAFPDFMFWVFQYNFFYIEMGAETVQYGKIILKILKLLAGQLPFLVLAFIGIFSGLKIIRKKNDTVFVFVLLLFVFNLITYFLGGRLYGHYFVQVIPSMVLLIGYLLSFKSDKIISSLKYMGLALAIVFLVVNIGFTVTLNKNIQYIPLKKYLDNKGALKFEVFYWSVDKTVIYYCDRSFATRFLHVNYQTGKLWGTSHNSPSATPEMNRALEMKEAWSMLMSDLQNEKPRFFVEPLKVTNSFNSSNYPLLENYLKANYSDELVIGNFSVYEKIR